MIRHNSVMQEGVLRDIVELLSDNVDGLIDKDNNSSFIGKLINNRMGSGNYFRSISKATSNLVLTFPMIVDNSVSIDTASMIAKAVEKKLVLMLQMLFSAISVTNNKDAFDFVSKVHRNLTSDDVLSYINKMDSIPYKESVSLDYDEIGKELVRIIKEDNIELNYDLQPALESKKGPSKTFAGGHVRSPKLFNVNKDPDKGDITVGMPINDYTRLIKDTEDLNRALDYSNKKRMQGHQKIRNQNDAIKKQDQMIKNRDAKIKDSDRKIQQLENDLRTRYMYNSKKRKEMLKELNDLKRSKSSSSSNTSSPQYYIDTKLDQPEIKKANEMVPSIMVVRFRSGTNNEASGESIIGVKVKLVYVTQADMIDRIILKTGDQNRLFEFLKATTGEISMFKDFMFALDRAKLDIFSKSSKSSPIWKLLERRANVSRTNSFFNNNNGSGTAIATLLVSQDTMDILRKDYNFNTRNVNKLINIMTDYSAMGFIIANDVTEKVQMLFDDNDISFETLSYSSLEREDKNQYKKVINLLAGK